MRLSVLFCLPLLALSAPLILDKLDEYKDHMATDIGDAAVEFMGNLGINKFLDRFSASEKSEIDDVLGKLVENELTPWQAVIQLKEKAPLAHAIIEPAAKSMRHRYYLMMIQESFDFFKKAKVQVAFKWIGEAVLFFRTGKINSRQRDYFIMQALLDLLSERNRYMNYARQELKDTFGEEIAALAKAGMTVS